MSVLGDFFLLNHIFLDIDIQNIRCVAPVLPLSDPLKFRCPWDPNGTLAETSSKRKITGQSSNMAINSACINASVTIWLRELVKYMSDPWSRRWLEAVRTRRTRWGLRCSRFQFDTTLRSSTIVSNNRNTLYIINGTRHQVDVQGTPKTCLTAIFVLSTSDLHTHRTRAFDIFVGTFR